MTVRSHYEILGVGPRAAPDEIREAYRRLARVHHPDRSRSKSEPASDEMHLINEAYRVLKDPGRRAIYDTSLRSAPVRSTPTVAPTETGPPVARERLQPARVPWRGLAFFGTVAIAGVFVFAQFAEPSTPAEPDGILRTGDCVEIEDDNDAREVACTGEQDLVVRAFVAFDATCPNGTEPHRDRQGMGVACIERPR